MHLIQFFFMLQKSYESKKTKNKIYTYLTYKVIDLEKA